MGGQQKIKTEFAKVPSKIVDWAKISETKG